MKCVLNQSMDFASLADFVNKLILQIYVMKMRGAKKSIVTKGTLCPAITLKSITVANLEIIVPTAMETMLKRN